MGESNILTMHLRSMDKDLSREEQEVVGEGVAYVVCSQVGLDTGDYSFGYLSSWKGDEGKMEEIGFVVLEIANPLIEKLPLN